MKRVLLLLFVLFILFKVFSCREDPKITISTPAYGTRTNSKTVIVKGAANRKDLILIVNSIGNDFRKVVDMNDGNFEVELSLPDTSNLFDFSLFSDTTGFVPSPITRESLTVYRELSVEEIAEKQKTEKARLARELAEERRWNQSKAGRIHKKHPEWSKEDCELLAKRKIWVGMSIDMLKYQRGLSNHANPSNYGGETHWQWCWDDYTPSCFYDNDGDGLVDSYN
ncbi:hypothetical protein GCM10023189_37240 [Nibrella saemangeumensis]|uniref:Lipoprotein n=1 Tax=Nibrella saemangeumensis TaxID=1084526 RepID=A0ABP8N892_9BACT